MCVDRGERESVRLERRGGEEGRTKGKRRRGRRPREGEEKRCDREEGMRRCVMERRGDVIERRGGVIERRRGGGPGV